MTAYLIQQARATHDANGNPRRAWLVYHPLNGQILAVIDEGYAGRRALINVLGDEDYRNVVELPSLDVTPTEYRRLIHRADAVGTLIDADAETELELRAAYGDK